MNKDFIIKDDILIKYIGKDKIVQIPEGIEIIKSECFLKNKNIEEIVIPETVFAINEGAFKGCSNLKKVVLPKNIKTINNSVFEDCIKLEKINLSNIKNFGIKSFSNTNLKTLSLSNKKFINTHAFSNCKNLKYVKLNNINNIELDVFNGSGIEKITIGDIKNPASLINYSKIEEIEFLKKFKEDEINTMIGCGNSKLKTVTGPNVITENGVVYNKEKTILISYLESKKNEYFKIPDSVKSIETWAIDNKHLKTIVLGLNTEELKESSVYCEKIILNNNLKKLNYCCINNCIENIDFRKTKIEEFDASFIYTSEKIKVMLPKDIKYINIGSKVKNYKIILNKKCNAKIIGDKSYLEYEKSLDELINEGKSFYEASNIIKNYER